MAIFIFFVVHWYASLFCQSFFHHRYSAHQMFTMSPTWEKIFNIISFITQGSSYLSPYAYGLMHRLHHAYADTEKDPHSPKFDDNLFKMMWKTSHIYTDIFKGKYPVEEKFTKNLPEWFAFERVVSTWPFRLSWMLLYAAFYYSFDAAWWMYFTLLPIQILIGPFHGMIINWFAHKYGYRNFEVSNTSQNLLPLDLLMWGECYHNNHHRFGENPNFGFRWFEIDPLFIFVWIFDKVGIVHIKPQLPNA